MHPLRFANVLYLNFEDEIIISIVGDYDDEGTLVSLFNITLDGDVSTFV